jgi:SAM-dependent methyltransferase
MMTGRFGYGISSKVVELASNDGYLLQYFKVRGVPVLGVEPAANVAAAALKKGIPTVVKFFGRRTGRELVRAGHRADLVLGNNVLAHVPDINDFVAGLKSLLKTDGVVTMEFPQLLRLMEENQFDTIYHEHFSYFSFSTAERVFRRHGLRMFDVQELPTHGGSLRIFARLADGRVRGESQAVRGLKEKEAAAGLLKIETYRSFGEKVKGTKRAILDFLIRAKRAGKRIAGYGAPAKGNTLLNYCGIRSDFLDFTVDISPHKQGTYLPGTRIPVYHPDRIRRAKPDYVLILPWNIRDEIIRQTSYIRRWGGKFVVPIPRVRVIR